MENEEFEYMDTVESNMWWYYGLHQNFMSALKRIFNNKKIKVLDAGCGTGGLLKVISELKNLECLGLEYEHFASVKAMNKSNASIINGTVNQLPIADNKINAIIISDILCQSSVNVEDALIEIRRCLDKEGCVLVNVPAYNWLSSSHDKQVHCIKRYSINSLSKTLNETGYNVIYKTYWNTLLFPLMVIRRKILNKFTGKSDVFEYPWIINELFKKILDVEKYAFSLGLRFPYGGSVFIVAKKNINN